MNIVSLPAIIALLLCFHLFMILISRDYRAKTVVFTYLIVLFLLWDICEIALLNSKSTEVGFLWAKLLWTFVSFVIAVFVHFALLFPTEKKIVKNKLFVMGLYLAPLMLVFFTWFTNLFILGTKPALYGGARVILYGPVFQFYAIYAYISFIFGLCLFYQSWKKSDKKRERLQGKWMFFACLIPIIGASITDLFLPSIGVTVFPLASSLIGIMCLMMGNAIHKYRIISVTPSIAAETIISMLPNVVILLSPEQKILYVNNKFLNILGYKKGDLVGEPVRKILSENEKVFGLPWQTLTEKDELEKTRIELLSKKGKAEKFDFTGTISIMDDELIGLVGIGTHIKKT
ncbi:histidine kinase N-terminal 7TM domain-containing protein [Elusimicrobiota bacterium]